MNDPLQRAVRLASRGRYRVSPNPLVGAVLVRDGEVVGEGWHRAAGQAHAEAVALREAGDRANGATLYLNLEPCSHHGRTPPCVEAIVAAGVRTVVASHADPDPRVSGLGFQKLRSAGIEVRLGGHLEGALALNLAYLVSQLWSRPAVTLKWAMSLDGRIATGTGDSRWISSPEGRKWALDLRESHDAILVGSGTLLADDPALNRRLGRASGPIVRVVLDRRLRAEETARLFAVEGPVRIYTESRESRRRAALERRGATVEVMAQVEPAAVLADLHQAGVRSLLVEGGGEALAVFKEAGFFDRVEVCCAPLLIGGRSAPSPVGGKGVRELVDAARLEDLRTRRRGPDRIVSGRRAGVLEQLREELARRVP